ncbi:MAG TPA: PASTA domain-containing protein [Acidobacteriota bacterium]|nr:PASTA domain-containing protein [Acidobacteriota bacterium]
MSKKSLIDIPIYALAFANLFFLSAVVFSQIILKGETVSVPDLSGKTLSEAKAVLEKKDLGLARRGTESNDAREPGRIVRQDPAPGSRIRVTKVVGVVTSTGSQKVAVPSLEGRSLEAAMPLLRDSGLFKGRITQIHTPRAAAGKILAQHPQATELAERNSAVGLLVSQGDREDRYVMPDLIGRDAESSIARLREFQFKIGDIRYSYYPGLSNGVIIRQSPSNGYRIQKRNLVTLEVSR